MAPSISETDAPEILAACANSERAVVESPVRRAILSNWSPIPPRSPPRFEARPRNAFQTSPAVITKRSESFFAAFAVSTASFRISRRDAEKASAPEIFSSGFRTEEADEKVCEVSRIRADASRSPEIRFLLSTETATNASPARILDMVSSKKKDGPEGPS